MKVLLITGGAGFIGSTTVRRLVSCGTYRVVNVDKLTYAGNMDSLASVMDNDLFAFERADICDASAMRQLFERYRPAGVLNLAAESHVDRSVDGPAEFIQTNVFGTFALLQEALRHWRTLGAEQQRAFRFLHVSTDEVYGSLGATGSFN